mmetsp:Transcript_58907/g.164573  ORF Transcript_58907/g.164573 Transcript_58907/m.164573 type:complete len:254 (+) Transcript_58907:71-832(+)
MWWRKRQAPEAPGADGPASAPGGGSRGEAAAKRARIGPSAEEEKELHDVQVELHLLEERCAEEQIALQLRYDRYRKPHFDTRGRLLRKIPGFWRAAFRGHPLGLTHDAELEALGHMQDLEVRDNLDRSGSFEVRATFGDNRFFEERVLVKRVSFQDVSSEAVEAATLTASGQDGRELIQRLRIGAAAGGVSESSPPPRSVLGWFCSQQRISLDDDLGDVLRRDLWQDPIPYFMVDRDATEAAEADSGARGVST